MKDVAELLKGYPDVDANAISRLSRHTWVLRLLNDPAFRLVPTPSRYVKSTNEDALFGSTLRTPSTIRTCISTYNFADSSSAATKEVQMIVLLESGLDSFPGTTHGGIVAVLLDEVMGILITLIRYDYHTVTAYLNVNFRRVLRTGGPPALCKAKLIREEGRKVWIDGTIEDGEGVVYAEGSGLFIKNTPRL